MHYNTLEHLKKLRNRDFYVMVHSIEHYVKISKAEAIIFLERYAFGVEGVGFDFHLCESETTRDVYIEWEPK